MILKINSQHTTQLETKFEKESWLRNLGQGCFHKEQESFAWSIGENVLFSRGLELFPSLVASAHLLLLQLARVSEEFHPEKKYPLVSWTFGESNTAQKKEEALGRNV